MGVGNNLKCFCDCCSKLLTRKTNKIYTFLGSYHNWVHSCVDGPLPQLAVIGGHDTDGTTLFIGRAHHDGDILPVKINPSNRTAYTCCEGYEIYKDHYEVLCGIGYSWIYVENGLIPTNAVSCGRTCEGEVVYIGRGHYDKSLTVGKAFRGDDCLYIPYGGRERKVHRYEVLIKDSYIVPAQTCETTYQTTYTTYEPGSYVVPADSCYGTTGSYVIPAKTGGCYEPAIAGSYVVPAKTGGHQPPTIISPAQTGGGYNQPPPYEKSPSFAGGLYPAINSCVISPPPSVSGFIKNEASSPYPSPSPQVNAYPPPPPMGFIKNETASYPPTSFAPPTITPAPIRAATTGSVLQMPMPQPPPPYEPKEEFAMVHKKPPAFGFQVCLT